MSNWWDVAPAVPAPAAGGNWFDAAPVATDRAAGIRAERSGPAADKGIMHALGRGAAQGTTFGFYDELRGLNAAGGGAANEPMSLGNLISGAYRKITGDGAAQAAYNTSRNMNRDELNVAREQHPIAAYGGEIAGGMAMPIGSMANATTRAGGALAGARAGMIGGGLYGAGDAQEMADVPRGMATGGALGAAIGAPLGALVTRPAAAAAAVNPLVEAGDRLGVNIPRFVASDSMPVQRLAAVERNIPFAGDRLVRAMDDVKSGMTNAADNIASGLGGTQPQQAGERASQQILDYMGPKLAAVSQRNYDKVDALLGQNASALYPMSNTQAAVANILGRRFNAGVESNGAAVDMVADAIRRRGLNYEGLKELRTRFGAKVSDDVTKDVVKKEFDAIYGALTQDLKGAVRQGGGQAALTAFEKANAIHRMGMDRKAALEKIIGAKGENAGERVFDKMMAMAGSTARGDMDALMKARKAMGSDAWNEFVGTAVQRLGRDAEGNWTPDRFVTAWGKMSDPGKALLFGGSGTLRQSLDDILTISSRIKDRYAKFGNPSGTAQNVLGGSLVGGGFMAPMTTMATVLGNRVVAGVLAAPATAASAAKWSKAFETLVAKPSAGAAALFQQASKNFAATIGDKLGVSVDPLSFMRAMQGPVPMRADEKEKR